MALTWTHEIPAEWDAGKASVVGGAPAGIFREFAFADGALIPGEWWRVESDGKLVGYGWMECNWAEAEITLAVAPESRGSGVGTFILDRLEREAAARGLNYLYNVVRESHPEREQITRWLEARRFGHSHDGDRLVRQVEQAVP